MKSLSGRFILVTFILICFGCATTDINKVQEKWGPPAKVENVQGETIYYYYFIEGKGQAIPIGRTGAWVDSRRAGWVCYELTCDESGKIIKKRKYWSQPTK